MITESNKRDGIVRIGDRFRITEWAEPNERAPFSLTARTYLEYCTEEACRLIRKGASAVVENMDGMVAVFSR